MGGDSARGRYYSSVMSGVVSRIKDAAVFALDPDASAMCVNVFLSRPSSILAALEFVRLQAPSVWIEYSNLAARDAFARMGNDNEWIEGGVMIEKTGLLLRERNGLIEMEAVCQFRPADGDRVIELLTARCTFDPTPGRRLDPDDYREPHRIEHGATGATKRYYDLLARDPRERAAKDEIRARFKGGLHPAYLGVAASMGREFKDRLEQALSGHVNDIFQMFTTQVLPSLILVNCKNAVESEYVPAPARLNKARRAKGRPEIGPYHVIKLHLRPKARAKYDRQGYSGIEMRGGLVMGHFKVRKTGVFWWSPFYAARSGKQATRAVRLVTP